MLSGIKNQSHLVFNLSNNHIKCMVTGPMAKCILPSMQLMANMNERILSLSLLQSQKDTVIIIYK